jgi:hypothetical protein
MGVQTIVNDVKGRVEPLVSRGQEVVSVSVDTLIKANDLILSGVQTVVQTQIEAGKDLFAAAQSSFEKAKTAGIKAVASSPADYLPEGRERVVSAYNDTLSAVNKTSDDVVKVVKKGYASVAAQIKGGPVAAPKRAAAKTVRKAKSTVKRAAKKVAASA